MGIGQEGEAFPHTGGPESQAKISSEKCVRYRFRFFFIKIPVEKKAALAFHVRETHTQVCLLRRDPPRRYKVDKKTQR